MDKTDRMSFLDSVSGIQQPEIIVEFFDHFLALKQIVEGYGKITVISSAASCITFLVEFPSDETINMALANIPDPPYFSIYGRSIKVHVEVPTDRLMQIQLR
jgi:hypothetical protein